MKYLLLLLIAPALMSETCKKKKENADIPNKDGGTVTAGLPACIQQRIDFRRRVQRRQRDAQARLAFGHRRWPDGGHQPYFVSRDPDTARFVATALNAFFNTATMTPSSMSRSSRSLPLNRYCNDAGSSGSASLIVASSAA